MRNRTTLLLAAGLALAACSEDTRTGRAPGEPEQIATTERTRPEMPAAVTADSEITRRVRDAMASDASLSASAQNATIETEGGVVTLRGEVGSEQERATMQRLAQGTPGVTRVDNQLEVDEDSLARE
jgi:osmotically-inducible protein OsmY